MFEKTSDEVIVTVEFEDGTRKTKILHTINGEWNTRSKIVKFKVIAWQPLPEPYRPSEELGEPKTNADRIRSMSDKELAKFLIEQEEDAEKGEVWENTAACLGWLQSETEE